MPRRRSTTATIPASPRASSALRNKAIAGLQGSDGRTDRTYQPLCPWGAAVGGASYSCDVAADPREIIRFIGRSSKRMAVTVLGGAVLAGGLAMLVLPGPGILVVALGFAILGTEYAWAAAALERTKQAAAVAGGFAREGVTTVARGAGGAAKSVRRRVRRH